MVSCSRQVAQWEGNTVSVLPCVLGKVLCCLPPVMTGHLTGVRGKLPKNLSAQRQVKSITLLKPKRELIILTILALELQGRFFFFFQIKSDVSFLKSLDSCLWSSTHFLTFPTLLELGNTLPTTICFPTCVSQKLGLEFQSSTRMETLTLDCEPCVLPNGHYVDLCY